MKKIGFFLASVLIMTTLSLEAQEITFYTPSTVRVVKAAPSPGQGHNLSLVVKASPENVKLKVRTSGSTTTYTSTSLIVTVDSKTGKVTFADRKGNILLKEGTTRFKQIDNGPDAGSFIISQGFVLDNEEPVYGLGLLQNSKMNLRGEHRHMVQSNLEDYAHFFQSQKGYGVYWDNYSPTDIDDGEELVLESQVGNQIDYYFMFGGNADGVIEEMRHLTGHVPMLPLWTYGFHQCRERYKSSKELLDVVGKGDCDSDLKWLAKKVAGLRIFEDENGKMNLSALSLGFDIMVVSQFTLYGDIRNGYRPSFIEAENPDVANKKYEEFQQELKNLGIKNVGHGIFGADMYIEQENSGPVTIWLDSKQ